MDNEKKSAYRKRISEAEEKLSSASYNHTFGSSFDATWLFAEARKMYLSIQADLEKEEPSQGRDELLEELLISWNKYTD